MASELPGTFVGEVLPMSTPKPKPNLGTILTENLHPAILNHIPARYKSQTPAPGPGGRLRSRSKPKAFNPAGSGITALKTSFSLWDGVRELQRHQWKESDIQHFVIAGLILFSLYIAPSAPALKFFALVGGSWLLLMPATGQFFRPSIPIWTWLIYFFCSRYVPLPTALALWRAC